MLRHHNTPRNPAICQKQRRTAPKQGVNSLLSRKREPSGFLQSDLKQVLVREVVSRVDLEDEDMVDSGLSPPIRVDPQEEDKLDQQETAPVDAHHRPHVLEAHEHNT